MGAQPGCCFQKDYSSINIPMLNHPPDIKPKKKIQDAYLQYKLEKPQFCIFKEDNEIEEIQHQFEEINQIKMKEFSYRKVLFLRSFWRVDNQSLYKQKSLKSQSNYSNKSERMHDKNNVKGILKNTSSSHGRNQSKDSDNKSKSNKSVKFETQSFKKQKKKKYNMQDIEL